MSIVQMNYSANTRRRLLLYFCHIERTTSLFRNCSEGATNIMSVINFALRRAQVKLTINCAPINDVNLSLHRQVAAIVNNRRLI